MFLFTRGALEQQEFESEPIKTIQDQDCSHNWSNNSCCQLPSTHSWRISDENTHTFQNKSVAQ